MKHTGQYHDGEEGPFLPQELDHTGNTVMSYNYDNSSGAVNGLAPFDLLALQHLFGANANETDSPVMRSLEANDYYFVGSALDDVLYFAPGPCQEYALSVLTSWGDDQPHVDVAAMEPWELIVFSGGHGTDTLALNMTSSGARNLTPNESCVEFYLADGYDECHVNLDSVERVAFTDQAFAMDTGAQIAH